MPGDENSGRPEEHAGASPLRIPLQIESGDLDLRRGDRVVSTALVAAGAENGNGGGDSRAHGEEQGPSSHGGLRGPPALHGKGQASESPVLPGQLNFHIVETSLSGD